MPRKHRPGCACCTAPVANCYIRVEVRNGCLAPLSGVAVTIRNGLNTVTLGTATTNPAGIADVPLAANVGPFGYIVIVSRTGYADRLASFPTPGGSCSGGRLMATVSVGMRPAPGLAVIQCEEPVPTGSTFNGAVASAGGGPGGCQAYSFSGMLSYLSSDAEGVGTWQGCLASDSDVWRFPCDQTYGPCGLGPLSIPAQFICSSLGIKMMTGSEYCADLDPITGQPIVNPVVRCAIRACPCDPDGPFYSGMPFGGPSLTVASCAPFAASAWTGGTYWEVSA